MKDIVHPIPGREDGARPSAIDARGILEEVVRTSDQARIIWGLSAVMAFGSFCLSGYVDNPMMTGLSGTLAIFSVWSVNHTTKTSRKARAWLREIP